MTANPTLAAILVVALLLPGIIAARTFYLAAQTREVEVPAPALSSSDGIAQVGLFSVVVHLLYALALSEVRPLPPLIQLPLADPYRLLDIAGRSDPDAVLALLLGLANLCLLAGVVGLAAGWLMMRRDDVSLFYGPLAEVIRSADGPDRFISAYVVTKIADGDRLLGYRGTISSLVRDADRYPSKVILKDVAPFYLMLEEGGPRRVETDQRIAWLTLAADDWHNIAFRVYRVIDEDQERTERR